MAGPRLLCFLYLFSLLFSHVLNQSPYELESMKNDGNFYLLFILIFSVHRHFVL